MARWHNRTTFKAALRAAPFKRWPVDAATGLPVGGAALAERYAPMMMAEKKKKKKNTTVVCSTTATTSTSTNSGGSGSGDRGGGGGGGGGGGTAVGGEALVGGCGAEGDDVGAWPLPDVAMDAFFDACTGGGSGDVAVPGCASEPLPLETNCHRWCHWCHWWCDCWCEYYCCWCYRCISGSDGASADDDGVLRRGRVRARSGGGAPEPRAAVFLVGFQVHLDAVVVKPILRDFFGVGARKSNIKSAHERARSIACALLCITARSRRPALSALGAPRRERPSSAVLRVTVASRSAPYLGKRAACCAIDLNFVISARKHPSEFLERYCGSRLDGRTTTTTTTTTRHVHRQARSLNMVRWWSCGAGAGSGCGSRGPRRPRTCRRGELPIRRRSRAPVVSWVGV